MKRCPLCKRAVDPHDPDTWKEITSWVGGPKKDSPKLRKDTGRYAHSHCVIGVQEGHAPEQAGLFDDPELIQPEKPDDLDEALFNDNSD